MPHKTNSAGMLDLHKVHKDQGDIYLGVKLISAHLPVKAKLTELALQAMQVKCKAVGIVQAANPAEDLKVTSTHLFH